MRKRCITRTNRSTGTPPQVNRYCMVGAGISSDPSLERMAHGTQQATQKTQHQNQRARRAEGICIGLLRCGPADSSAVLDAPRDFKIGVKQAAARSEEHTSEL